MDENSVGDAVASARYSNEHLEFAEAVVALDELQEKQDEIHDGEPDYVAWSDAPVEVVVCRVMAYAGLERYLDGLELLETLKGREHEQEKVVRAEALFLEAHVLHRHPSPRLDEALQRAVFAAGFATDAARALSTVHPWGFLRGQLTDAAVRARVEAAELYALKGCRPLAERELAEGRSLAPDDARLSAADGDLLAASGEPGAARKRYEQAIEQGGLRSGCLGLARLHTRAGAFAEAHRCFDRCAIDDVQLAMYEDEELWGLRFVYPYASGDLVARRRLLELFVAEQRWKDALCVLSELHLLSGSSDGQRADNHARAMLMYRRGKIARAAAMVTRFRHPAGSVDLPAVDARRLPGRLARRGVEDLPRRLLGPAPSPAPVTDAAAPPAVELVLRRLGRPAEDFARAREKPALEGGGPLLHRLRAPLAALGLCTRRIEVREGTVDRLLEAGILALVEPLDAGSPAVELCVGYDHAREVVELESPVTGAIRWVNLEDAVAVRRAFLNGALAVVPEGSAGARLDAAGAVESAGLGLVDDALAALDEGRAGEADRLLAEALACDPAGERPLLFLFRRARDRARAEPHPLRLAALGSVAARLAALAPGAGWAMAVEGAAQLEAGRAEAARDAFQAAIERGEDGAEVVLGLAESLLGLGREREAAVALSRAVARAPSLLGATVLGARLAERLEQPALAWTLDEIARVRDPECALAHRVHAALLRRRGELDAALLAADLGLSRAPGDGALVVERARVLAGLGRRDEAVASLQERLAAHPGDAGAGVALARTLLDAGSADAAVAAARAAVAAAETAEGREVLGRALAASGELAQALGHLERAVLLRPGEAQAAAAMGEVLGAAGYPRDAIEACAAAAGASGDGTYDHELGLALSAGGFLGAAVAPLRRGALARKLDEEQLTHLGETLLKAGGDPLELFDDLGEKDPDDIDVCCAHARVLLDNYHLRKNPFYLLDRIQAERPFHPLALTYRGLHLLAQPENEARAEKLMRDAVRLRPSLVFPRLVLSETLCARGRAEEALPLFDASDTRGHVVVQVATTLMHAGRYTELEQLLADNDHRVLRRSDRATGLSLRFYYQLALLRRQYEPASRIAAALLRMFKEEPGDRVLPGWHVEVFKCLLRLDRRAEADAFARASCKSAEQLGRLAYWSLELGQPELGEALARSARELDPAEVFAGYALGRLAEVRGDVGAAVAEWHRYTGEVQHVQLARIALGLGDLELSLAQAEHAVPFGRTGFSAFVARAQARCALGDLDGALADIDRAWATATPEFRADPNQDLGALHALFHGDHALADELFAEYLREGGSASALDRARVARVVEHARAPRLAPAVQQRMALPVVNLPAQRGAVANRVIGSLQASEREPPLSWSELPPDREKKVEPEVPRIPIRGLVATPPAASPFRRAGPVTAAQRWALAVAAVPVALAGGRQGYLGGARLDASSRERSAARLAVELHITDRQHALRHLGLLRDGGDSVLCDQFTGMLAADPATRARGKRRLLHQPERMRQYAFVAARRAAIGGRSLVAWDVARLVALAGAAYLAGYLPAAEEAWGWVMGAAVKAQATYGSWEELGRHYVLGAAFDRPASEAAVEQARAALMADPASPFRTLAWGTPLGDARASGELVAARA